MYNAPLLKKAIEVIKLIARQDSPLGVTEISKSVSFSKSTTFGILKALESEGFIFKDAASKKYSIGHALLELSQQVFRGVELSAIARPYLEKLVSVVDETVFLGIREDNKVKVLDVVEARKPFKITSPIGIKFPITASALGKVFLSAISNDEIKGFLKEIGLPRYTDNSITDIGMFLDEIEKTRQSGFGIDIEEYLKGVHAIATLIYSKGVPVGAVLIVGFSYSMNDEKMPKIMEHIKNTANQISERIAHLHSTNNISSELLK